jgi:hypothetical protein
MSESRWTAHQKYRLAHHLFRPFMAQVGWLYRYAETNRPLHRTADWCGDRLDDFGGWVVERRIRNKKPVPWSKL